MVDAHNVMDGKVPPARGVPGGPRDINVRRSGGNPAGRTHRERLTTCGEGNGKPEPIDYEWRAADTARDAEVAAQVKEIRAQAAANRAAELGITVAEAEKLRSAAKGAEVLERDVRARLDRAIAARARQRESS